MNIFINIYNNWTIYEWLLLGGSFLLIFLFTNLATYLLTKDWRFNIPISLSFLISVFIYILSIFTIQFLGVLISHLFLIPIFITVTIITINWFTLISYFFKFKNSKKFSLIGLIEEYKRDTIRDIVFMTLAMLAASIFLKNELLVMFIITYINSATSIYLNTLLLQKFLHD